MHTLPCSMACFSLSCWKTAFAKIKACTNSKCHAVLTIAKLSKCVYKSGPSYSSLTAWTFEPMSLVLIVQRGFKEELQWLQQAFQ